MQESQKQLRRNRELMGHALEILLLIYTGYAAYPTFPIRFFPAGSLVDLLPDKSTL